MPRGRRKQFDPAKSGPVDGDYSYDQVFGVPRDRVPFLASDEDLPRLLADGGIIETRREGAPKPAYDLGGPEGEAIRVRNLTLVTLSKDQAEIRNSRAQRRADEVMEVLSQGARATAGGIYNRRSASAASAE